MFYVIYNPSSKSGKGIKLWRNVRSNLEELHQEYRVYKTTPDRDASYIVKNIFSDAMISP